MKSRFQFYLILSIMSAVLLAFAGCYTQIGATRDEGQDEYGSVQNEYDSTTTGGGYESGYNNDQWDSWHHQAQLGFSFYQPSYYWPSYAFASAYSDPWFYDCYWSYDPWRSGNSYYGGYGYYGSPFYGYSSYYYTPYYSYYPPAHYRYVYTDPVQRGSREFGSTRGESSPRGGLDMQNGGGGYVPDRGGYNLPGAARVNQSTPAGGVSNINGSTPKQTGRQVGSQRAATPRSNDRPSSGRSPDVRAWGSRGGSTRGDASQQPNNNGGTSSFTPPATTTAPAPRGGSNNGGNQSAPKREPSRGSRDSGGTRGGNPQPSYTPPPPPPQQQSSPPPSSAPANTGARGGSTRGNRP